MYMKNRNINIEILRIISMFMVIILHFLYHGHVLENLKFEISIYNFLIIFLETFSIVAVNIYILISAYYLSQKNVELTKIKKIYLKTFIISIIIGIILLLLKQIEFNLKNIITICLPFTMQLYWFVNAYLILLFLSPYINMIIDRFNQNELKKILITLLVINSIIPFISMNTVLLTTGNSVFWFINLYLIAGYIKKYNISLSLKKNIFFYLLILLLMSCFNLIIYKNFGLLLMLRFLNYNNIWVLILSVLVFLLFINSKQKYSRNLEKFIMFFSKSTFAVYLISDNKFVREILWKNLIDTLKYNNNIYMIIYIILNSILIFLACVICDKIINSFKIFRR